MKTLWTAIQDFMEDDCMEVSAALAFYTVLSLAPLLVLAVMIAGFFVRPEDVQGEVAQVARQIMGPEGAEQLKSMMGANAVSGEGLVARVVSLSVLAFGATGVMIQLQSALNRVWEVQPDPQSGIKDFIFKRLLSLAMILAVAFILLVSLVATTVVRALANHFSAYLGSEATQHLIAESVTFLTVVLLFGAMFKLLPDAKVRWRDVWMGAGLTALLFTVGKFLIGMYVGSQNLGSTYGAASSLVLLLLWTYYSSIIFFFGAELTQAWAHSQGHPIQPKTGAVRVDHKTEIKSSPGRGAA